MGSAYNQRRTERQVKACTHDQENDHRRINRGLYRAVNALTSIALSRRNRCPPRSGPEGHTLLHHLIHDEEGATAIEYGLIAALISLAAVIAFQSLGLRLEEVFNTVNRWMGG